MERQFRVLMVLLFTAWSTAAWAAEPAQPDTQTTPEGYSVDARGRVFQTSFDLTRRFHVGVHDTMVFGDGWPEHALLVETGFTSEIVNPETQTRQRFRIIEGRLSLAPLEADALLFGYDISRHQEKAPIWITTFIGAPRRFDVPISIGAGFSILRMHYRRVEDDDLAIVDFGSGHINWELYQGRNLEDYVMLSTRVGMAMPAILGTSERELSLFPELGLRAAFSPGERGLTRLEFDGRLRRAWVPKNSGTWVMGSAALTGEQIIVAVNDQPISLFLAPEYRYYDIPLLGLHGSEFRALVGARISLFVPPRGK